MYVQSLLGTYIAYVICMSYYEHAADVITTVSTKALQGIDFVPKSANTSSNDDTKHPSVNAPSEDNADIGMLNSCVDHTSCGDQDGASAPLTDATGLQYKVCTLHVKWIQYCKV